MGMRSLSQSPSTARETNETDKTESILVLLRVQMITIHILSSITNFYKLAAAHPYKYHDIVLCLLASATIHCASTL
ncbi:hypothetical protein Forpe1208_v002326 [Fusarium oxysporum f. sp. rapae]|uniref:Uncharacterized protein n=1 Tax=Fusarium oxysporum f. sp. rapae TaxID=485398 RepID=A0A8J5PIZ0_FUSOX|nr:hypothetical protein Forpe1208_v002326 [Fusarium oxysporum f. sp. rapae]